MATDRRKSVYMGEPLLALMEGFDSLSPRINTVAERYPILARHATPALAEGEWLLLCDILNSTVRDANCARILWAEIEDSAADGAGEKWGVDTQALAARVLAMAEAERVAILEVVDRWWAIAPGSGEPAGELLRRAGAKVANG